MSALGSTLMSVFFFNFPVPMSLNSKQIGKIYTLFVNCAVFVDAETKKPLLQKGNKATNVNIAQVFLARSHNTRVNENQLCEDGNRDNILSGTHPRIVADHAQLTHAIGYGKIFAAVFL